MSKKAPIDQCVALLLERYGLPETLAALCREVHLRGFNPVIFRKLNRVYEWMTKDGPRK